MNSTTNSRNHRLGKTLLSIIAIVIVVLSISLAESIWLLVITKKVPVGPTIGREGHVLNMCGVFPQAMIMGLIKEPPEGTVRFPQWWFLDPVCGYRRVKRWGAPVPMGKTVLFHKETGHRAAEYIFKNGLLISAKLWNADGTFCEDKSPDQAEGDSRDPRRTWFTIPASTYSLLMRQGFDVELEYASRWDCKPPIIR